MKESLSGGEFRLLECAPCPSCLLLACVCAFVSSSEDSGDSSLSTRCPDPSFSRWSRESLSVPGSALLFACVSLLSPLPLLFP